MAASFNELFGLGSHSEDASLRGWWPMQDDAASATVDDASSNANDGTLNGDASVDTTTEISTTGPNSWLTKALTMDGSSNYIDLGLSALGSNSATMLMFVKIDTDPPGTGGVAGFGVWGENTQDSHYTWTDSNIYCSTWRQDGEFSASRITVGDPTPALTSWRQVCVKSTSGTDGWQFRIDGSDVGTATGLTTLWTSGGTWQIGKSAGAFYLDGDICHHAVFSRKLTDAEEAQAFAGPEPINTVAPAVTGTESVGSVLSCSTGTWALDAPFSGGSNGTVSYSYQWTRSNDGAGSGEANIAGATSSTYTLVSADEAKYIRCLVAASNTGGGNDPAADTNSNFTGAIAGGGGGISIPVVMNHRRLIGAS